MITSDKALRIPRILAEVTDEMVAATSKFPPFHSPHEGYAVLKEEVDELWDAIKANDGHDAQRGEAIQIAAMAIQFILDVTGDPVPRDD